MINTSKLDKAHNWIDSAYQTLSASKGMVLRQAQVQLSKDIATALIEHTPIAAEAPTGTGKSLAYLIGALAQIRTSSESSVQPVVVATATKALQSQLIDNDIPMLTNVGLVSSDKIALAKGRSNYICLVEAGRIADAFDNMNLSEEFVSADVFDVDPSQLADMINSLEAGLWDGDFDSWEKDKPQGTKVLTVAQGNCIGRRCPEYNACAFYKSRRNLETAEIIVGNHNLVLADLKMSTEEEGSGVFPMEKYRIVFDEAHHLPETALRVSMHEAPVSGAMVMQRRITGIINLIADKDSLQTLIDFQDIKLDALSDNTFFEAMAQLMKTLALIEVDSSSRQHRFAKGIIPDAISSQLAVCLEKYKPLNSVLHSIRAAGQEMIRQEGVPTTELKPFEEMEQRAREVLSTLNEIRDCFKTFIGNNAYAKWIYRHNDVTSLNCSPLEGADFLRPNLWDNPRVLSTAMVSATLRDLNGFSRFSARSGLPATAKTVTLPHIFDYKKSELVIAGMTSSPKFNERAAFMKELEVKLPLAINPKEATLVLCPSWFMLRQLVPLLRKKFGSNAVLVQGEKNVGALRKEHSERVAAGATSILIGTASLAEGLDLPGSLCSHVVILTIPFSVPNSAVELEVAEKLGRDYFSKRSLPDAMVRLVQMVGRLVRRESDSGKVTVFDRRLTSTSYGRSMLASLPPFTRIIENT